MFQYLSRTPRYSRSSTDCFTFLGNWFTHYERVASETVGTGTHRYVSNDIASCRDSANSVARVPTLSLYARLIGRTFRVN